MSLLARRISSLRGSKSHAGITASPQTESLDLGYFHDCIHSESLSSWSIVPLPLVPLVLSVFITHSAAGQSAHMF